MAKKQAEKLTEKQPPAKSAARDAKGRFTKQEGGQTAGKRFAHEDGSASAAGKRSGEVRRERADLRKLCQAWMEAEVGTGKDGEPITGGQMMVRVAAKEISKGNPRFWELLRDTAGFKPVDKVMVADVDPAVIAEVEAAVQEASDG